MGGSQEKQSDNSCMSKASNMCEGEKNHKKGGVLNCVFKNFSFLRSEKLFPDSESDLSSES